MTFKPNPDAKRKFLAGVRLGLAQTQLILSKTVRTVLSRPGTGRIYRIGVGRRGGRNLRARGFHRASAPGNPPAVNTNRLRSSWSISGDGRKVSSASELAILRNYGGATYMGFTYGSNVKYAPMLEFGTRRMRKRPYLAPSMRLVAKQAPKIFRLALAETMR